MEKLACSGCTEVEGAGTATSYEGHRKPAQILLESQISATTAPKTPAIDKAPTAVGAL